LIARCKDTGIERQFKAWLLSQSIWKDYSGNRSISEKKRRLKSIAPAEGPFYQLALGTLMSDLDDKFKRITDAHSKEAFTSIPQIPHCSFCHDVLYTLARKIENRRHFVPDFSDKEDIKTALTDGIKNFMRQSGMNIQKDLLLGYYVYAQVLRYLSEAQTNPGYDAKSDHSLETVGKKLQSLQQ
jgi:hypothetical protein